MSDFKLKLGLAVVVAGIAYWKLKGAAEKVEKATEVVKNSINPMHRDNLAHVAAEKIVGEERLSAWGDSFFDAIDRAAEFVGIENGINGIKGTNADAIREAQNRAAGNRATKKFGGNANG